MAKPNRKSCISGTPTIIAERQPVAPHLQEFLDQDGADAREARNVAVHDASPLLLLQLDEDVFQAGRRLVTVKPGPAAIGRQRLFQRGAVVAADMQRGAEEARHNSTPGLPLQLAASCARTFAFDHEGEEAGLRDHLGDRAARHQLAVQDIDDAVAAFGLVHVMGGDQHGQAFARSSAWISFPEIAPRLGIDAGGRFVEQQQLRVVQHAGGQRHALLPAAGEMRRPAGPGASSGPAAPGCRRPAPCAIRQFIHARDEFQILADRQIFPEAEALGHVADLRA